MWRVRCWAHHLGLCSGPITDEHLISKGLLGRTVRVESAGAPSFQSPGVTLPTRRLVSNILCEKHNQELGRTADWAAIRMKAALRHLNAPNRVKGSTAPRLPMPRKISGTNLARWACKTHCNFMITNRRRPDPDYVAYSFLQTTRTRLRFYWMGTLGQNLRFLDPKSPMVGYTQYGDGEQDSFDINLAGFQLRVSRYPIVPEGVRLLDRPARLQMSTPAGMFMITLDWSGEPPYLWRPGSHETVA